MKTYTENEDFIFEIIHDIKAPILSMDFALKTVERNDFLEELYQVNKHNLNYIENMLDNYSLSKGKYCPKFELVNLNTIIKEEIRVLSFLITEKNLNVIFSRDKIDDPYFVTDKYLIRQIILNLLTNAVKYTPVNGILKIVFEKIGNNLTVCFSNPYDKKALNACSTKMGLEIVRKKLKAIKGRLKINKLNDEICFSLCFNC